MRAPRDFRLPLVDLTFSPKNKQSLILSTAAGGGTKPLGIGHNGARLGVFGRWPLLAVA
jgi:hypothetical protein